MLIKEGDAFIKFVQKMFGFSNMRVKFDYQEDFRLSSSKHTTVPKESCIGGLAKDVLFLKKRNVVSSGNPNSLRSSIFLFFSKF